MLQRVATDAYGPIDPFTHSRQMSRQQGLVAECLAHGATPSQTAAG